MRRRLILLAVAAVPAIVTATAHGCSNEPPFESVCDWMADPANCFREFHQDMLAFAGANPVDNPNGDCRTYDPASPTASQPTEASGAGPGTSNGAFAMRAMLDTCTLDEGGQVKFNPPIDLTMYPPSLYAAPITYAISITRPDGNECGNVTYTSPHGFSFTVNPPPDAGTTAMNDAAPPFVPDASFDLPDASLYPYGTYTQVIAPGRDAFDVTCPSGEAHHLNLDEVAGPPSADGGGTSQCPALVNIVPSASLQIFLGGIDTPGAVSLAINWPPITTNGTPDNPYIPDGDTYFNAPVVQGTPVVYFNCSIPAASETCFDTMKDGAETDVDCGGPQIPSKLQCGNCPVRCEMGQQCNCDRDCDGLLCLVDPSTGIRKCNSPAADAGTPTHFPICAYDADAGPTCP